MACRVIDNEGDNFIRKIIPFDSNVDAIIWPSITQLIIKQSIILWKKVKMLNQSLFIKIIYR